MQGFIFDFFLIFKNKIGGLPVAGRNKVLTFMAHIFILDCFQRFTLRLRKFKPYEKEACRTYSGIHPKRHSITKPFFNGRKGRYKDKIS
jgi:hypothetical protein